MTWTLSQIEKLKAAGKIQGYKSSCTVSAKGVKKPNKTVQKQSKAFQEITKALQNANIAYETEYRFDEARKFRFDIAIPEKLIAIEYEGIFSTKSRHTSFEGYTRDATKYNLAASKGWKIYRYTAMNYKNFESDLKTILENGLR